MSLTVSDLTTELKEIIDSKNESALVQLTSQYASKHRDKVVINYKSIYGMYPADAIKKALKSGPAETLLMYAWTDAQEVRARLLNQALSGKNNKSALIDVVLFCGPEDWYEMGAHYTRIFQKVANDTLLSDIGNSEPWSQLIKGWIKHDRYERKAISEDAAALMGYLESGNPDGLIDLLCNTTEGEWKKINKVFTEKYGVEVETLIASNYVKTDMEALLTAHFYLLQPGYAAAYLCSLANSGKKGDSDRMVRITSLMFDKALKCKFAYEKYGKLGSDFKRLYDARLGRALCALWRVDTEGAN